MRARTQPQRNQTLCQFTIARKNIKQQEQQQKQLPNWLNANRRHFVQLCECREILTGAEALAAKLVSWLSFWASFRGFCCCCYCRQSQSNYVRVCVGVVHCLGVCRLTAEVCGVQLLIDRWPSECSSVSCSSWPSCDNRKTTKTTMATTQKSRLPNSRVQVEWLNLSIWQLTCCLCLRRRC